MQFEVEEDFLQIKQSDLEHDQELLQIQRRKSTPKVVIEEFVAVDEDGGKEGDEILNEKNEENKSSSDKSLDAKRPHKVMTHIEIEDFSKI